MTVAADRLSGALPDRVSENQLMRRYEVSRGQVLKILNRIAAEGWAERLPGHGWAFLPMLTSPKAYDHGYRFRAALEPASVLEPSFRADRAMARAAREQQVALLNGTAMRLTRAQLFQINADFHEMLVGWSMPGAAVFLRGRLDGARRIKTPTLRKSRIAFCVDKRLAFSDSLHWVRLSRDAPSDRHVRDQARIATNPLLVTRKVCHDADEHADQRSDGDIRSPPYRRPA